MLMKKEVIEENKRLKRMLDDKFMKENPLLVENGIICLRNKELKQKEQEITDLKKQLSEEKQVYINMYNMYDEEKKKNERAIEYGKESVNKYLDLDILNEPYRSIFTVCYEIHGRYEKILKGEYKE